MLKIQKPALEVFLSDFHFPTEDRQVMSLVMQVLHAHQPDILWLNGDMLDFKSISRFPVKPSDKLSLPSDIEYARKQLIKLRQACPNAKIFYKIGNHELRSQKYLWGKAPELADLEELSIPSLLRFKDLDITCIGGDEKAGIGRLHHLHGHEIPVGYSYPAKAMLARVNDNVIFGHVHRFSVAYQNSLGGGTHVAWSIGCGQTLDVDWTFHPQWQQGFALIEYCKGGLFHVNPIEIFEVEGKKACMVYGQLFKS